MNPQIQSIKQVMNMMKNANDPNAFITGLANNNPQFKQIMDMVQSNGGDAKTLFYTLAKQKGIDPEAILNSLK